MVLSWEAVGAAVALGTLALAIVSGLFAFALGIYRKLGGIEATLQTLASEYHEDRLDHAAFRDTLANHETRITVLEE